ncbi:MAG: hypothetical protein DCF15_11640 [Phormidesmis priestleyi]|uniref:Uncharacterized protein n=1 Tax=Phormidesmis priestleyi TaxID=268141 RepID=A0A2W4XF09_9CYAN|nr:MAG: hypothetical protein DCF15_11640 [Phormidesmis priestleyi]
MDRIQLQASKLWDLLFAEDTATTYQTTLNLTGTILKEIAQLIWLIICSFFVFGAWFSDTTVKTGKSIRDWVDTQASGTASAVEKKPLAETGKSLLETTRTGIIYLLNQAREQLGIEPTEVPAQSVSRADSQPVAEPVSEPVIKAVVTPSAAPSASVAGVETGSSTSPETSVETSRPAAPVRVNQPSDIDREEADDGWPQTTEED